jgi:hypothetical protein
MMFVSNILKIYQLFQTLKGEKSADKCRFVAVFLNECTKLLPCDYQLDMSTSTLIMEAEQTSETLASNFSVIDRLRKCLCRVRYC